MKTPFFTALLLMVAVGSLFGQGHIVNTIGAGGTFSIKDGSTTFLSLSQSLGHLNLTNSLTLPVTTSSTFGIIFKGADRFIHDFKGSGTDGQNTFVGVNSGNFTLGGTDTEGSYNTAVGRLSLNGLSSGDSNSGFGYQSLYVNATGSGNCAYGAYSLASNTNGAGNAAFGIQALFTNIGGGGNAAFGQYTLLSSTGNSNSAFGGQALIACTGNENTALGYSAGQSLTTGSNNTIIGSNAQPSGATVSNEITLGNTSVTVLRTYAPNLTSLSDRRDKRNIKDLSLGLDFLMNVRPRQFNWDRREWYVDDEPDGSRMKKNPTAGFIAQELDEAQTNANAEWLNLVLKSNPEKLEATPGNLLPIVVKAIQELKMENDDLRRELKEMKERHEKWATERNNEGTKQRQDETSKVSLTEN